MSEYLCHFSPWMLRIYYFNSIKWCAYTFIHASYAHSRADECACVALTDYAKMLSISRARSHIRYATHTDNNDDTVFAMWFDLELHNRKVIFSVCIIVVSLLLLHLSHVLEINVINWIKLINTWYERSDMDVSTNQPIIIINRVRLTLTLTAMMMNEWRWRFHMYEHE